VNNINFKTWFEYHHDFNLVKDSKDFKPLKSGDTIKVYHGFDNKLDAVLTAKHGLSGKLKAMRRYSYEAWNNPKGLFVTAEKKLAKWFAAGDGVVIEFIAKYEELEPPVWAGNLQDVMGKSVPGGEWESHQFRTKSQRKKAQDYYSKQKLEDQPDYIKKSDNPYMALIMHNVEGQALFIGDLNPNRIISFSEPKDNWKQYNLSEFLRKYKDLNVKVDQNYQARSSYHKHDKKIFMPDEEFDPEKFIKEMNDKHSGSAMGWANLNRMANRVKSSSDPRDEFINIFNHYLWPKQYYKGMVWLMSYLKD